MLHVKQLAWCTGVFVCAGLRQNKSKQTKQKTPKQKTKQKHGQRELLKENTKSSVPRYRRRNKNKTRTEFVIENRN